MIAYPLRGRRFPRSGLDHREILGTGEAELELLPVFVHTGAGFDHSALAQALSGLLGQLVEGLLEGDESEHRVAFAQDDGIGCRRVLARTVDPPDLRLHRHRSVEVFLGDLT